MSSNCFCGGPAGSGAGQSRRRSLSEPAILGTEVVDDMYAATFRSQQMKIRLHLGYFSDEYHLTRPEM